MSHVVLQVLVSIYFTKSTCLCFFNSYSEALEIERIEILWRQLTHPSYPSPSNAGVMFKVVKEEVFLLNRKFKLCEGEFMNVM